MTRLQRSELEPAVRAGILGAEQADRLAEFFGVSAAEEPRFTFVHVLYYLGGMIAIGAMSLFMTLGWNALGGWGGFFTAVCYGALALTHWFLEQKQLPIPARIMATLAVVMVPPAIFGAQMALGYWDDTRSYRDYHVFIDWRWIMMEFGTLALLQSIQGQTTVLLQQSPYTPISEHYWHPLPQTARRCHPSATETSARLRWPQLF